MDQTTHNFSISSALAGVQRKTNPAEVEERELSALRGHRYPAMPNPLGDNRSFSIIGGVPMA